MKQYLVHYIALQAVHYKLLQEVHLSRYNHRYRRSLILLSALLVLIALATVSFFLIRRRRLINKAETSAGSPASDSDNTDHQEQSPQTEQGEENEFIEKLGEFIREAMDSGKVDFEDIASRMCISRTHLNRKVKSITGGTTSDLVLSYRIAKAKELLLSTDLPIWEVAEQCGISDPAYFSTLFKKAVGKSPGQLRKEHSKS